MDQSSRRGTAVLDSVAPRGLMRGAGEQASGFPGHAAGTSAIP